MPGELSRSQWTDVLRATLRDNPLFAMSLGLCPALAVSYRVDNAVAMGGAVLAVVLVAVVMMSVIGRRIPGRFLFAAELIVASSLTTVAELLFEAFAPAMSARLGIYVPLIAVNCLVLGRSERFAAGGSLSAALRDGLGGGLGFFVSLLLISLIREVLGSGTITLFPVGSFDGIVRVGVMADHPARVVGYSAGALLVLGYLQALSVWVSGRRKEKRR